MAPNEDRSMFTVFASLTTVMAFLLAAVGIIVVVNDDGTSTTTATAAPVTVTLSEFKVAPASISVPAGGSLNVVNAGTMIHNLAVVGQSITTPDIAAGKSATLSLATLPEGTYTVVCTIPGHESAGMKATLVVTAGAGGGTGEVAAGAGGDMAMGSGEVDYEAMDANMVARTNEYLAAFTKSIEGGVNPRVCPPRAGAISPWCRSRVRTASSRSTSRPRSSTGRSSRARS